MTTTSNHPLLTKWLALAMHRRGHPTHREVFADVAGALGDYCYDEALNVIGDDWDSDPAIADRLEAALDVCQWMHCWGRERERRHTCLHKSDHEPTYRCHPFVPLVTP